METPRAPTPPPFIPINIPETIAQAIDYDVQGFDWSDQDFLARFPGLVATRNQQIEDAYNQLTGPLDSTVEGAFTRTGLTAGLNSVGGGDPLSGLGLTEGSAGRNAATTSFVRNVLNKQDADRQYFDLLIGNNPQRGFGISGGDAANLSIANTGGLNASNQQNYQSTLAGIYGAGQYGQQTGAQIAAIGNILASLGR